MKRNFATGGDGKQRPKNPDDPGDPDPDAPDGATAPVPADQK